MKNLRKIFNRETQTVNLKAWNKQYDLQSCNCADFVRYCIGTKSKKNISELVSKGYIEKPIQLAKFGDIVFNASFSHVGICVGYPNILHFTNFGLLFTPYEAYFAGGYAYEKQTEC